MRRVNLPLLIAITIAAILVVGGVYLLHRSQLRRNAGVFLNQAQVSAEDLKKVDARLSEKDRERRIVAVVHQYNAYLALRPRDVDAIVSLADFLRRYNQLGEAAGLYEKAVRLEPNRDELRRKLVDISLDMAVRMQSHPDPRERVRQSARFYDAALQHLEQGLLTKRPNDAELLGLAGQCCAGLARDDKAADYWQRAILADPQQVDAHNRLAGLFRHRLNRREDADKLMAKLVDDNMELHLAQYAAASYSFENGEIDAAIERVNRALAINDKDRGTLMLAARSASTKYLRLMAQGQADAANEQLENARAHVAKLRELYPTDPDVYLSAAEIEGRAGQTADAAKILSEGLEKTRNNFSLLYSAVDLLIDIGKVDEAREIYKRIAEGPYSPAIKNFLEGRLCLGEGRWRDAVAEFNAARPGLSGNTQLVKQSDYYTGQAWAQLDNYDQAIRAYRLALDSDPFYVVAQSALMEALMNSGQIEPAMEIYRQLSDRITPAGLLTVARLLVRWNLQLPPAERDWRVVERILDRVGRIEKYAPQAALLQADIYLAQDRRREAEQLLDNTRMRSPTQGSVWATSVLMAQQSRDWPKVDKLLEDAEKQLGDKVELRLAKARYFASRYRREAAERVRGLAENVDNYSDAERQALWNGLVSVMSQIDDVPSARELSRRLADADPRNVQLRFALFELALRAGDQEAIPAILDEIKEVSGEEAMWHFGMAALLSIQAKDKDKEKLSEALGHLDKAIELRPSWARIQLLRAGIYDQLGNSEQAFKCYRDAIDRGERNVRAIQRLTMLQFDNHDYAGAQKTLALLQGNPEGLSGDMDKIKQRLDAITGDVEEALDGARRSAKGSKEYRDHLWLGQLSEVASRHSASTNRPDEAAERHAEAEESLLQAVRLAMNLPDPWIALVRFYSTSGEYAKAENAVKQAATNLSGDGVALALGQCYEAMGDAVKALEHYEQALAQSPDKVSVVRSVADFHMRVNRRDDAKALAQKVLDGKIPGEPSDIIWARRAIVAVLIAEGGDASLQRSLELIEQNLKTDANSVTDLRLKGMALSALPSRPETREAIEVWRKSASLSSTPDDQFILAQLYLKEGNWSACSTQMRNLLALRGDEPRYLVFYTSQLLRRGEFDAAEPYLVRLEKAAGNQFATVRLRAEMMVGQTQYEAARQLLKAFIDRRNVVPADRTVRLRLVAEAIEQFSKRIRAPEHRQMAEAYMTDAEMLYKLYVAARPEHKMLMVAFLARLGRINEALDMLEANWEQGTPPAVASATLEFARSPVAKPEEKARLESIIQKAMKKFDDPIALKLVMAELYQRDERIADAEQAYRDVIAKDPKNVVALNNLAVLLAWNNRNLNEALNLVERAIAQAGRDPQILDSRASVYIAMRRPNDALRDLEEALDDAREPVRLFHQAQAYYLTGNRRQAAETLQSAIEGGLKPEDMQTSERKAFTELKKVVDLEAAKKS